MTPRISVRLRRIIWPADFRRSEATLYREAVKKHGNELKGNDAFCFVSGTGEQILWVYAERVVDGRSLLVSSRLRITNGSSWRGGMLANYAAECGIELIGIKRFEERYKTYHVEQLEHRRKLAALRAAKGE